MVWFLISNWNLPPFFDAYKLFYMFFFFFYPHPRFLKILQVWHHAQLYHLVNQGIGIYSIFEISNLYFTVDGFIFIFLSLFFSITVRKLSLSCENCGYNFFLEKDTKIRCIEFQLSWVKIKYLLCNFYKN